MKKIFCHESGMTIQNSLVINNSWNKLSLSTQMAKAFFKTNICEKAPKICICP